MGLLRVRMDETEMKKLKDYCKARNITVSSFIKGLVSDELNIKAVSKDFIPAAKEINSADIGSVETEKKYFRGPVPSDMAQEILERADKNIRRTTD